MSRYAGPTDSVHWQYSVECAQCGHALYMPEWSEETSPRSVRHLWSCSDCGYQFETTVFFAERQAA